MQEEITQKTLALCVEASKMTAQLLQQAIKKVLADMEKHKKNPQLRHGKQTLRQLMKHNTGVSNIEITDQNIRAFFFHGEEVRPGFCVEEGHFRRAYPLPGVLQGPGRRCDYSGLPGVLR